MYRSPVETVAGLRRSLANGFRLDRRVSTLLVAWSAVAWVLPLARAPWSARARWLAALGVALRALLNRRSGLPWHSLGGHVPGLVLLLAIQLAAGYDFLTHAPTEWKARHYPGKDIER
jgi:hypothetical protein